MTAISRTVTEVIECEQETEGKNAKVYKGIGSKKLRNLDPFVILYDFTATWPAGFPDHPHRGFETVTYVLSGDLEHEDFLGNRGVLHAGDVQYMMAGKGVVHSEMPHGESEVHGIQLWINLKAEDKLMEPVYQELLDKDIPKSTEGCVSVKIISGETCGLKSEIHSTTPFVYYDYIVNHGGSVSQMIPAEYAAFVYILSGSAKFGPRRAALRGEAHQTLVLSSQRHEVSLFIENTTSQSCRFLIIGGLPIEEPVVQQGPFVMNTQVELRSAMTDFKKYKNGFENARKWKSHAVQDGTVRALF